MTEDRAIDIHPPVYLEIDIAYLIKLHCMITGVSVCSSR